MAGWADEILAVAGVGVDDVVEGEDVEEDVVEDEDVMADVDCGRGSCEHVRLASCNLTSSIVRKSVAMK